MTEVKRHTCHCCLGVLETVSTPIKFYKPRVHGERIILNYDAGNNYWCSGCWGADAGKHARRMDKLKALADDPRAAPAERAVARMRIEELRGRAPSPSRVAESRFKADWEALRMTQEARIRRRTRHVYICAIISIAGVLFTRLGALPKTGPFWATFGLMLFAIGCWFMPKFDESRQVIYRVVFVAAWFSLMGWLWQPGEQLLIKALSVVVA